MEEFLIQGWDPILPGVRWLYIRTPASDWLVGLGFSHRAGRCRPGESPFSPPACRSFKGVEGFLKMGSCRPRVALALVSSPSQSAICRWGEGFHTVRGGVDPGVHRFSPGLSEL